MSAEIVLLDALGTLVALDDPGPHLADGLAARGVAVPLDDARRAMGVEMAHYKAHCDGARDATTLAALRDDCARIVARELGPAVDGLSHEEMLDAMLGALRFSLYPEVPGVLAALRDAGHPLVVVSNWDVSLHAVAGDLGLDARLDGIVTSAEEGVAKPDPELLHRALAAHGGDAAAATMVGDTEPDVLAGVAAGVRTVLVDRFGLVGAGALTVPDEVLVVPDLRPLPGLLAPG